jgi:hypothetical protein
LDFLSGKFNGYKENFTAEELTNADVILTTLESSNLINPTHKTIVTRRDIEAMPYEDTIIVAGWEKE